MKRDPDRFIAGRSDDGQEDVSAEVYVTVTDEGGRPLSGVPRYLVLAVAIFAAVAVLLLTSLGPGGSHGRSSSAAMTAAPPTARSARVQPSASASASLCVRAPGYGGLGARLGAFDPNNNNSTGAAGPTPGPAFYTVTAIARGCVTAFAVQDSTNPPLSARDLLMLVSHPYLPGDAKQVMNTHGCAVWRSATLDRATGRAYAQATSIAQAGSIPGRAQIELTSNSTC